VRIPCGLLFGAAGYGSYTGHRERYGLQINKYVDERKNLEKSTYAGARSI
jgi:hypothetical protein